MIKGLRPGAAQAVWELASTAQKLSTVRILVLRVTAVQEFSRVLRWIFVNKFAERSNYFRWLRLLLVARN
jgi:hypothetical protein